MSSVYGNITLRNLVEEDINDFSYYKLNFNTTIIYKNYNIAHKSALNI